MHSYVQMPDGRTGYLSELKAGEVVLRVNAEGETEEATVGRVKIERRSMVSSKPKKMKRIRVYFKTLKRFD